jgi:hypothetical protein
MSEQGYGELRLPDGTLVRTVPALPALDWNLEHSNSLVEALKPDFLSIFDTTFQATGTLTQEDIASLMHMVDDHCLTQPEICVYVPNHRYWQIQYAQQGKWYPRPHRRKSPMRMSKKWRMRRG